MKPRSLSLALLLVLAGLVAAPLCADTTYIYVGNQLTAQPGTAGFNYFAGCEILPVCALQVEFTVANPLAPNLFDDYVSPTDWVMGDSYGVSLCCSPSEVPTFLISTDSAGNITNWAVELNSDLGLFPPPGPLAGQDLSYLLFSNNGEDFEEYSVTGLGIVAELANSGDPGTWTMQTTGDGGGGGTNTVPEPGSLGLIAAGGLALGTTVRRKLGATVQRVPHARAILMAVSIFVLSVAGHDAHAATILVTTTDWRVSGGPGCSLEEAIWAANLRQSLSITGINPDGSDIFVPTNCTPGDGNDTIVLPVGNASFFFQQRTPDPHNYMGPTATPLIFSNVTIEANGAVFTGADSQSFGLHSRIRAYIFRAFAIGSATVNLPDGSVVSGTGSLILRNAQLYQFGALGGTGGECRGGGGMGAGGAIYASFGTSLTVESSSFLGNEAEGGTGGTGCGGAQNVAPRGGGGGLFGDGGAANWGGGGGGGAVGDGGGGGTTPDINTTATGGGGGGGTLYPGGFGYWVGTANPTAGAGGLLCGGAGGSATNTAGLDGCAGGGGGGGGSAFAPSPRNGGTGGYGGGGGGGGLFGFSGNGGFGGGGGGAGGNGGFGGGGGGCEPGVACGEGGAFAGNGGFGGGGGGGAGLGGAIFSEGASVVIHNSTFVANSAFGGQSGGNGSIAQGQGVGGAIFALAGSLEINDSTIASNAASDFFGGSGGGIGFFSDQAASFTLRNTIVANNSSSNVGECFGSVSGPTPINVQGSGNLITSNFDCPGVVSSVDPNLGFYQYNGGLTVTMAIAKGSSAYGTADPTTSLTVDQRGVMRPSADGHGFDIGAYEVCVPRLPIPCVTLVIAQAAQLTMQVIPAVGGTTSPPVGQTDYPLGSVVAIQAMPAVNWAFNGWSANVVDPTSPSTTVILNQDQTVTASFAPVAPCGNTLTGRGTASSTYSPARVGLVWGSVAGLDHWDVLRGTALGGPYSKIASVPASTSSYLDNTGLQDGHTYDYTLNGADGNGNLLCWSNQKAVLVP